MKDTPRTDERKASFALDTIRQLETELTTVTEQRDRLIEAIKEHKATMQHRQEFHDSKLYEALQSLTTNEP